MAIAKAGKNLPEDYNFTAEKQREAWGPMGKNHKFVDGEYIETPYIHVEYPKMKYHPDYVHEQKPGTAYGFTESAQLVNNPEEEKALGTDWKDTPGEVGKITAPDAKTVSIRRAEEAKEAGKWRKGANIPQEQVTDMHLEFARANGVPNLEGIADLYKFLATLTGAQFRDFMQEASEWAKPEEKRGPGRPKKENTVA